MISELRKFIRKLKAKKKRSYLYRSGWSARYGISEAESIAVEEFVTYTDSTSSGKRKKKKDSRIEKRPVEIFKEILSKEPKVDLRNLDSQIEIVKKRKKFLEEELELPADDEEEALKFLLARKKYLKHQGKFRWSTTTFPKIEALCKKYKVKLVNFDSYYKTVPMEAFDELEKFISAYDKVRNDKPVIKLIIDSGGKETRKDPILLVGSPFGKWFFVLGAWDKEVEIVDDLIYKGK
ncbi:hypothetical protein KAW50_03560 [candidate division WOR-3 bacterium]|nr:hypothetical protein [candidate division WOR-3 bacterium]